MEKVQTKTTLPVRAGGSSRQRCSSTEGGRRPYDPTLYSHLPSHEIALPPSDDEGDDPQSSTVPLGSGSKQDWMGSQVCRQAPTPTYTDLLEGRTPVGYDTGLVDLSFGLRSGSDEDVTHTVVVNPASGTNHTTPSVRASGLPDTRTWCSGQSGDERGLFPRRRGAVATAGVVASRTRTRGSARYGSTTPGGTIDGRQDDDECSAAEVVRRKVWDDHRQQSREASTSGITRGVAKINVGVNDNFGDCDGAGGEDCAADDGANENDEDDDGEMEICPIGRKWGGSRATNKCTKPHAEQRGKKGEGKHRPRIRVRRRRAAVGRRWRITVDSLKVRNLAEEGRVDDVRRDNGRRDGKREGDDDDDRSLVTRLKGAAKEDDLEERSKLWVDCDAFWGQDPGKPLREAVGDCADYFVVIANRDGGVEPPSMLIMSSNDVQCFKIDDPAQREPTLCKARSVEKLVLRTIHGWIFKSSSRSTG
ncbi:hypothetical protein CBR_g22112 [Chara braunii]|uniref:Uncharacterized protein n=1 Tax=Chara braunii TaxID=69332 RepID=A0A388L232_CHABU|nr:hypothetical protein CBR_g22112 [Chara braunii]|eukprot:GBG76365.1 hypothetical protein CBR_g22112 [Chara braunii]